MEEVVDDFIGRKFGKDGHLTVTGWDGRRRHSLKMYAVHCEVCAKDPELFGDGTFYCTKSNLTSGQILCGCSKSPRWTEEQNVVRISRECEKRSYEFLGFAGEYKGSSSKLKLKCTRDNHTWQSTILTDFLNGHGCVVCRDTETSFKRTKPNSELIAKFRASGAFSDSVQFSRNNHKSSSRGTYWDHDCPICSVDEYVQAGLCSGIFSASTSNLTKGYKSCRCSNGYRWTKEQREYQINKIISDESLKYKFVGWDGQYIGGDSRATVYWCFFGCLLPAQAKSQV